MKLKKKKNYIEIFFFEKKVSALAFVNEMQLWIEWPHTPLPPPPDSLLDWADTGGGVYVCAYLCVQLLCDCFPEPEPSLAQREMADCGNDRAVLQCTGLNVKLIFNV